MNTKTRHNDSPGDAEAREVEALTDKQIEALAKSPDDVMATMCALNWAGSRLAYQFTRSTAPKRRLHAMCAVALNIARSWQTLHAKYLTVVRETRLPNGARYITCKPMTGCHHDEDEGFRWVIGHNEGAVQPWVVWVMDKNRECECGCYFTDLAAASDFFHNNCE